MTKTCCDIKIRGGGEELLRWWAINNLINYTHATENTTVTTIRDYHGNHKFVITYPAKSYSSQAKSLRQYTTLCHLMMVVWPKHVVAVTSEEELLRWRTINCWVMLIKSVSIWCHLLLSHSPLEDSERHWKWQVGLCNSLQWMIITRDIQLGPFNSVSSNGRYYKAE
jgi:hypothetical protein